MQNAGIFVIKNNKVWANVSVPFYPAPNKIVKTREAEKMANRTGLFLWLLYKVFHGLSVHGGSRESVCDVDEPPVAWDEEFLRRGWFLLGQTIRVNETMREGERERMKRTMNPCPAVEEKRKLRHNARALLLPEEKNRTMTKGWKTSFGCLAVAEALYFSFSLYHSGVTNPRQRAAQKKGFAICTPRSGDWTRTRNDVKCVQRDKCRDDEES